MGKRFFRKKGNLILYEKFKLSQSSSVKKEDILAEKHSPDAVSKESKIRKYIEHGIPITIIVTSLYANSGCSFISYAFANYLRSINYSALLLNKDNLNQMELNDYNFIIIDVGKYKDIPKVLETKISQAQIKIMVCLSSDIYLKGLSQFIKTSINPTQWKFFFNLVPEREYRKISDLMEDYEYFIVQAFHSQNQEDEKELRCCFKSVLLGKV